MLMRALAADLQLLSRNRTAQTMTYHRPLIALMHSSNAVRTTKNK